MTLRFAYRAMGAPDLHRRGLRPETAPPEVLLVDVEADLAIRDGDRAVVEEGLFPVAELARDLVSWLRRADDQRGDFEFDSMSYAEAGEVRIAEFGEGWRVGSVSEPDAWTSPVDWDVLVTEIKRFVTGVRKDIARLGADPRLIPEC